MSPTSARVVADHADSVTRAATLRDALDALPPRQRLAIALRFHGDLSVREISRAMRCSEGTVKSTLHAALQRLKVDLVDERLEGVNDGH